MLKYQWIQFCRNTTLHGWKYTVLHKTTKCERIPWIIICLAALMGAILLVLTAWSEFQLNPIITVTESTQYPIYKFVFPAVTICSLNRISKKLTYEIAHNLKKPDNITIESLAKKLALLFQLANNDYPNVSIQDYKELQKMLDNNKRTPEEVFKFISPACNMLIKKCMWKGKVVRCDGIFETIKTSVGYCCSFNYFALKNYSFSGTFPKKSPKKPRRVSACGYQSGLEILINTEPHDYFATHIPSVGVGVLIHYPYDFPNSAVQNNIICEMNTNNFIGITPTIITASDRIRNMAALQRKCLYPDERYLTNFAVYSFHNCMVECWMFLTLEHCGCVPFYLYNNKGSGKHNNVCSLEDIPCLAQYQDLMYNNPYVIDFASKNKDMCNCLPNCEGELYRPEVSNGVLDATYSTNQFSIHSELPLDNHTVVRVFFNDLVGTRLRKDSLFTWHTLMGYYGGIMGLVTGFSFISLVEICYFSTIRLVTDLIDKRGPY